MNMCTPMCTDGQTYCGTSAICNTITGVCANLTCTSSDTCPPYMECSTDTENCVTKACQNTDVSTICANPVDNSRGQYACVIADGNDYGKCAACTTSSLTDKQGDCMDGTNCDTSTGLCYEDCLTDTQCPVNQTCEGAGTCTNVSCT